MAKALRVGIRSPREWNLIKNLTRGSMEWEQLNSQEKLMLLESSMDITQIVEPEKVEQFKTEIDIGLEDKSALQSLIRSITSRLVPGLPP